LGRVAIEGRLRGCGVACLIGPSRADGWAHAAGRHVLVRCQAGRAALLRGARAESGASDGDPEKTRLAQGRRGRTGQPAGREPPDFAAEQIRA